MTDKQNIIENQGGVEDKNTPTLSDEISNVKNSTRENTLDVLLDKLIRHFEARKHLYRIEQVKAFENLIKHLQEGNDKGLIKLPMGTGKTFLFSEICKALGLPTIILVPRVGLVNDTKEEMVGSDKKLGVGFKEDEVYTISSKETGTSAEKLQKIFDENDGKFKGVLVTTYASLNSIRRNSPELFDILIECCGFIVSDEAHRSLGDQTKETGNELFAGEAGDDAEKAEQELEEVLEKSFKGKVHLFTTATPRLIDKDVRDENDTIYSATIQQVADSGDLIIPKRVSVGKSFLHIERRNEEDQRFNLTEADLSGPLDKYRDIDGNPLYETLSNKYVEEKEHAGGYLPGVGFCTTVEQAEFVTEHLKSIGVRAVRCTSDKPGVSKSVSDVEAKRMLENNEIDVVVTCTKVGEGWDVPTLRSAIWYTPTQSPVKNLQGNGRIMRTISEHLADVYREAMGKDYKEKTADNTIIIEPESWEVIAFEGDMDDVDIDGEGWGEKIEGVGSVKTISGSHEMMYEVGELSKDYLEGKGIDLIKEYSELDFMTQEEIIELHKQELQDIGIESILDFIKFGANEYYKVFGIVKIGKILGSSIGKDRTYEQLENMLLAMGFPSAIDKHLKDLEELGVTDMSTLVEFGPKRYHNEFGNGIPTRLMGEVVSHVTRETILGIGEVIGFSEVFTVRHSSIQELRRVHLQELKDLGIENTNDLINFGTGRYKKEFASLRAKRILGITERLYITQDTLKQLGLKLGLELLDEDKLIDKHLKELEEKGINDMEALLKLGLGGYKKLFGRKYLVDLGVISEGLVPKFGDVRSLGTKLGFESVTLESDLDTDKAINSLRKKLKGDGIVNVVQLIKLGSKFQGKYGTILISTILGENVKQVRLKHLRSLGETLGLDSVLVTQKGELLELGINNLEDYLNFGRGKYSKNFGFFYIKELLGITSSKGYVTQELFLELGETIFGEKSK